MLSSTSSAAILKMSFLCFLISLESTDSPLSFLSFKSRSELLSSADIFQRLKKINPAAMRGANPASLAQILIAVGIERKHTKFGNVYRVVSV